MTYVPLELKTRLGLGLQPRRCRLIGLGDERTELHCLRSIANDLIQHAADPASVATHSTHLGVGVAPQLAEFIARTKLTHVGPG